MFAFTILYYMLYTSLYNLLLLLTLSLTLFFSLFIGILAYAPELFEMSGVKKDNAAFTTVLLGIIKVIFTFLSMYVVDIWGRKPLLLIGVSGLSISLLGLSIIYPYIHDTTHDITHDNTHDTGQEQCIICINIAIFFVCTLVASYAFGYGPVTWLLTSELFSDQVRGKAFGTHA